MCEGELRGSQAASVLSVLAACYASGCGGDVALDELAAASSGAGAIECAEPPPAPSGPPCSSNADCPPEDYCDFPDDLCGDGEVGVCREAPLGCEAHFAPVCTCDGDWHSNAGCAAAFARVDLWSTGACPVADGYFACGSDQCDLGVAYCQRTNAPPPLQAVCVELPDACLAPPTSGCECLADTPCGNAACSGTRETGLGVTCACR
jgi:hypothetical protein